MIGLIMNLDITSEGNSVYTLYKSFTDIIPAKVIGIPKQSIDNMKEIVNLCDKVIFQGGDNYTNIDIELLRYLYDIDKPTLGICLGMQEMAILFNGELGHINNHKKNTKYAHGVSIKKGTKLYEILNTNYIITNSSHKDYVTSTNLDISGYNDCIEAIEDKTKKFFIGVQWHPEKMYNYDTNAKKLIDYFINLH